MAWFETWIKNDLAKPINVVQLQGVMFNLDNLANKIGVELEYNGQPAALEGTIAGYVIRNDGTTLNLTTNTGKEGNKAWVILPQEAYTVEGPISIVIKLVYNSAETTIGACAGYVTRSRTSSEIAPTGTVIPSLASLEAAIAAANAAAANAADATDYIAPTEEESTASAAHAVGSYFIYDGKLMKATSSIAQGAPIVPYASGVTNYNCAEVQNGLSGDVYSVTNTANVAANNAADAQQLVAPVESMAGMPTGPATMAHAKGTYFVLHGMLYKATANIAQGATFVTSGGNANCELISDGLSDAVVDNYSEIGLTEAAIAPVETRYNESTSTASASHATGSYFVFGGVLYEATADIDIGDNIVTSGASANCRAVPGGVTGEVADLKSAFDGFINGDPHTVNILTDASLVNGNYAVNDDISTPTASNYRKAYNVGFSLEGDPTFIASTGGLYNIAFNAFDANGKCISTASTWLSDGTYTAAQIKTNAGSSAGAKYSFQIKDVNGGNISSVTVKASDYYVLNKQVLQQIGTNSIEDGSVTEGKLSSELQNKINSLFPSSENLLVDCMMVGGAYAVGDDVSAPTQGVSYRRGYQYGFELSDDLVFIASSNGAYKIAFAAFDEDDECISAPTTWLTDGTYSAADIMANARSYLGKKYSFQVMYTSSGAIPEISTLDYFMLKSVGSLELVDLFMFMGQSNMAGRGEVENAPTVIPGAGYEYRAISAPNVLTPMVEPFGATESKTGGIDEGSSKTGSMVVAFTNAYYQHNGSIPVVGISASKGGTAISEWQPNGAYLTDAVQRLTDCVSYLTGKGYAIRHKYILWCQGETDGDNGTTAESYKTAFGAMLAEMMDNGIEKLFMVRIGNINSGASMLYETIMDAQTEIAQTNTDVVMASTDLAGMRARGLMKDAWHYYQAAYNEVGTYAGINVALYEQTGKESTMYDTKDGSLYYSHKN